MWLKKRVAGKDEYVKRKYFVREGQGSHTHAPHNEELSMQDTKSTSPERLWESTTNLKQGKGTHFINY